MNSRERRKADRNLAKNYPYIIQLEITKGLRYFEWDRQVVEMTSWCKCHARNGWVHKTDWKSATFHFTEDQHATLFALRWA